jgi:hypothetical protein
MGAQPVIKYFSATLIAVMRNFALGKENITFRTIAHHKTFLIDFFVH